MNMTQPESYQALVLGSGAGGKLLAWHLATSGQRTAVVERKWIGGSCPNINCLPSKNEIWSAKVADLVHHAAKFGLATSPAGPDMGRIRQRKRARLECGRLANALAVPSSRTCLKTTSESSGTTWLGGRAARATDSFPIAYSPTRRWRTLA
jgi:choline dehydrogenase-like flavoprotein